MTKLIILEANKSQTKVSRACPFCGHDTVKVFDTKTFNDGMEAHRRGALLQDAFPSFSPDDREFILTGICNDCWGKI